MTKPSASTPSSRSRKVRSYVLLALLCAIALAWAFSRSDSPVPSVGITKLEALVKDGSVMRATVDDAGLIVTATLVAGTEVRADGAPSPATIPLVKAAYPNGYADTLMAELKAAKVRVTIHHPHAGFPLLSLLSLGVMLSLVVLLGFTMKRQMGGAGALSGKQSGPAAVPETRFEDVVGCDEAVAELREISHFLAEPERFTKVGARIPSGFLLVGPPGTGKTMLARACAGEAGVPFFAMSGSDFVEMFVGVGAARVRRLFTQARKHERAIIFIDELDSVGKSRKVGARGGASDEQESTLNALLVEMDGFAASGIVVLAATNRPDVLDPALLRPGRFDRQIQVAIPDRRGREQLFTKYLATKPCAELDLVHWARRTPGMCGADIAAVCNDAALECARREISAITPECLETAVATAYMGRERRSALVTDRDRDVTAWHEAGHSVVALLHSDTEDPVAVSIIPRGPAGGVTWLGSRDEHLMTASEARAQLAVSLAGRAAEQLRFGEPTQGARDDIRRATELATAMTTEWGMTQLGPIRINEMMDGYPPEVGVIVRELITDGEDVALRLLAEHHDLLERVASALLERESLDTVELHQLRVESELAALINPPSWPTYLAHQYRPANPSGQPV